MKLWKSASFGVVTRGLCAAALMVIFAGSASKNGVLKNTTRSEFWLTKADGSVLFQKQPGSLRFKTENNLPIPTITIDPAVSYQEMDGFGCTLTGGSAQLIQSLPRTERAALLRELFSTDGNAIGISYLRISIGASDLDERIFSYDDLPSGPGQEDPALANFSITPDKKALIPVLKQILSINPGLKLLGSPWSAPAWMKTTGSPKGGYLKPEYYDVYAQYLVKYVKAMRTEGISIDAVTIQNEPRSQQNNPSMLMTAEEQGLFIKGHLGPAFRRNGLKTKLIIYDHNCDTIEYPLSILADTEASRYIDGSAFHLYGGDIAALSLVHDAYPGKNIYFTEQWVSGPSNFPGDFKWHITNLIIGAARNWSRVVLEWNLASDPEYRPHTDEGGCVNCQGAVTIGEGIRRDVAYYALAHVSKFVRPGSTRISSDLQPSLPNVAFKTPSGSVVLIVANEAATTTEFAIKYQGKTATASLPGNSAGTYVITGR